MYEVLFQQHAELLKALAHPKRLEIINVLKEGSVTVQGLQQMLGLAQANVSQHLKILRDAGAVAQQRKGQHVEYRLAHRNFAKASEAIRDVLLQRQKGRKPAELTERMKDLLPVALDPVCGMRVSPRTAGAAVVYHHVQYYFCAAGCRALFLKHPETYV